MTAEQNNPSPDTQNVINVNQRWAMAYWKGRLGVTDKRLREAIDEVGPQVAQVRAWLKQHP